MALPATSVTTLERHIIEQERRFPGATGQFSGLMYSLTLAAKIVQKEVRRAGIVNILGRLGRQNIQGEEVQKLDVYAHRAIFEALDHTGHLCVMASEEVDEIIPIPKKFPVGKYVLNFDPLDGSSNIDANVSIGTIFSVHRRVTPEGTPGTKEDVIQPGYKQVAAGYVLYGSSTMFVYTTGLGVHGFTLDPSLGEFVLSHENIQISDDKKIYSVNEGNYHSWDEGVQRFVDYVKTPDKATRRPYSARYIGSLVADFHRNLLYGGIFMYPGSKSKPQGKLRLLYEAAPLAFIAEQAGGRASNGYQDIMKIEPTELHQRVPLFIGTKSDVDLVEEFIQGKR
ncbi:MAG: class 1 fructose-bisphosphatase [Gemmatimonadetes bacterium]|nr:MAG: class 1 fructose-bisphosphatase [Gemmatimonadota bacterium]